MIKGREILGIHKANVFLSKSSVCSITPPSVSQVTINQLLVLFLHSNISNLFRNASFIFLYFISNLQLSRSGCYCYLNKEKRIFKQT